MAEEAEQMKRKTKLIFNSASSLLYQITTMVCGFILPRLFIKYYGSEVNGLISSITQFLGFISLAECGVGAVVQSALYKPLAEKDNDEISRIVVSSDRFFRKIAYILAGYTAILMAVYPLITLDSFGYLYTLILIFVISISAFAQYYIGMTYRLLLSADQLGFIQYSIHSVSLIVNTVVCSFLIRAEAPIQSVKLTTSLIFMIQPFVLALIARKRYKINRQTELNGEPIKQKWNGLAQHIAAVVLGNTDTVVLTLFSTLKNVSVYAVYHLVVNGVKQIVVSLTNGMQALLGNMLAKNETEELNRTFDRMEWVLHTAVTLVFSITALLIIPFVKVYTANIEDSADYIVPAFAYMITLAQAAYCLRLPYNIMVLAAGHYRQTQASAIIEAVINVVVSVILVFRFGLIGVAIGTLAAMVYRTVYLAVYLSKNIIYRKLRHFLLHISVDILGVTILFVVVKLLAPGFYTMESVSYLSWFVLALKVGFTALAITVAINAAFYFSKLKNTLAALVKKK